MKHLMLKPILITCISLLTFSINGNAQNADEVAISKVLSDQVDGWNNGSVEDYMKGYWNSELLQFIGKNGIRRGYKNTLANYKKSYPDSATMGKLKLDIVERTKLSQQYYFITGKWYLKRSVGDLNGYFTILLRKIKGRWLIVSDHSS